jgi:RHS repeat-associated protein
MPSLARTANFSGNRAQFLGYKIEYRFSFNGMEKDNETYGEGNALDFGARIYDARLGKFLGVDPLAHKMPAHSPYSFSFNGMENDKENYGEGNALDFGARIYDSRLGRWLSCDPLASSYPYESPYDFAVNTPIQAMDPDGARVYFVVYTNGCEDIQAAAWTRLKEIQGSKDFDAKKDHVYFIYVTDLGTLESKIRASVNDANRNGYGKTVEASFFSHGAADGPVGDEKTSKNNLADLTRNSLDNKQMTPTGWSAINFNFDSKGSIANFFGCNLSGFAESFLVYQPNLTFTSGVDGPGAGGTYNCEGSYNETWYPSASDNVYMRTATDGMVDPVAVFKRGDETNYSSTDIEGNKIPTLKSIFMYGNPSINNETKKVESGSN